MLNLNQAQQEAVLCTSGSVLIVAGAGSGKTRVITSRIMHLLGSGVGHSQSIIALTFTNKAAREMRERIQMTNPANIPFIGTFHAYCVVLLKRYGSQIGLNNFSIMDSDDQEKLLHDLIKRFAINKANPKQLLYHFSSAKNSAAVGETYPLFEYDFQMRELMTKYETEKKHSNCLDFDDLIIKTVELLEIPEIKIQHQARVRHVLVDEYQDTSVIQHKLLKLLSLNKQELGIDSVCVVGDEDQSIYSWRGATVDNILQFPKEFPNPRIIKIEQNYRSASSILETANFLIKNNYNRNPKNLWSEKVAKNRVLLVNVSSGYQEADLIGMLSSTQYRLNPNKSLAVLYRTHFQSRSIEESLLKQGIPYQIIGGIQFYERKEIKDLIAYLKVVVNPHDRVSFSRIYNCPPRKLGEQFAEQFFSLWQIEPFLTCHAVSEQLIASEGALTSTKKAHLCHLLGLLNQISADNKPSLALRLLVKELKYLDYIKENNTPEEAQSRIENVHELIRAAEHFESDGAGTITVFLEEIALMQDKLAMQDGNKPHIQLMTLHAAKGLEFDTVILSGVEEGLIPSTRSLNSSEAIEEERRLLYVGITRAKEHLILVHAKSRNTYGQINDQSPSRFVQEIAPVITQKIDASLLSHTQLQSLLEQFLKSQKFELPTNLTPKIIAPINFTTRPKIQGNSWKVNQPVSHAVFGVGLVQKIEPRDDHAILTVKFKVGVKKLSDKFLQK